VAIPTRKNHPNVAPSDPCCSGATNSANFNPGETSISTAAGRFGSFSAASANPTNPNGNAPTAGNITRNSNRAFMNSQFTNPPVAMPPFPVPRMRKTATPTWS